MKTFSPKKFRKSQRPDPNKEKVQLTEIYDRNKERTIHLTKWLLEHLLWKQCDGYTILLPESGQWEILVKETCGEIRKKITEEDQ